MKAQTGEMDLLADVLGNAILERERIENAIAGVDLRADGPTPAGSVKSLRHGRAFLAAVERFNAEIRGILNEMQEFES